MGNVSQDYIELLSDLRGAPLAEIRSTHSLFWFQKIEQLKKELELPFFHAYHLGTIPSEIDKVLLDSWFLRPNVNLQRVGLYADVIVFDDLVGNSLTKLPFLPSYSMTTASRRTDAAISKLCGLKEWTKEGIVKILPADRMLGSLYEEDYFDQLLDLSYQDSAYDLPDAIKDRLSPSQQRALTDSAGYALVYKSNKALMLKELLDLVPSADDTFYEILCEKLEWDNKQLDDTSNLFVLRRIRPQYLCSSTDLVLELRKENNLARMRQFFREQISDFFGEDLSLRSRQGRIDEFSRILLDQMKEADSELEALKRKFGAEAITNISITGLGLSILSAVDFGLHPAEWIPKIIPAAYGSKNLFDSIRAYMADVRDIKRQPTFLLGSKMDKKP